MGRVLCYGVVGVDYLLQVSRYPEANGHARVRREEITVGGEAANTAVRLSQLNIPVTLMGNPVGFDSEGRLFTEQMAINNVDNRIEVGEGRTGHAYVVSDREETRTIFGAFGDLKGPSVSDSLWPELDLVTVDPFVDGAVDAARTAHHKGIPVVSIEVEPDHPLTICSDTVINSAGFLRRHDIGDPEEIANRLLERGVETVVITRGADGADVFSGGDTFHQPIHPVHVVDTTGAGDGFRAGLIAARVLGRTARECLGLASVVAALSCCYCGGCGGSVDSEEAFRVAGLA